MNTLVFTNIDNSICEINIFNLKTRKFIDKKTINKYEDDKILEVIKKNVLVKWYVNFISDCKSNIGLVNVLLNYNVDVTFLNYTYNQIFAYSYCQLNDLIDKTVIYITLAIENKISIVIDNCIHVGANNKVGKNFYKYYSDLTNIFNQSNCNDLISKYKSIYKTSLSTGNSYQEIFEEMQKNDYVATMLFNEYIFSLNKSIELLSSIIDPDYIVLNIENKCYKKELLNMLVINISISNVIISADYNNAFEMK